MRAIDEERFAALIKWNRGHGGHFHPDVEVYKDDVTGFSLRSKEGYETTARASESEARAETGAGAEVGARTHINSGTSTLAATARGPAVGIKPGDVIITCPLSTTLSYLNALTSGPLSDPNPNPNCTSTSTASSPAFPAAFMLTTPPHVIGRFFLVQQYLQGAASHWHPYIVTLPQPEHAASWTLPAFWPEEDADLLCGTNAGVAAAEMTGNAAREFREGRRALREAGFRGWREYTSPLYRWAFCIFTSRSFRPSLVVPGYAWEAARQALDVRCGMDDFSVLMPLFDIANHDPLALVEWDFDAEPGICRLVVGKGCASGEQVFNNYGMKTNSELLLGYGFVIPETELLHNDYVHLRLRASPTAGPPEPPGTAGVRVDEGEGTEGAGDKPSPPKKKDEKPRDFLISLRSMSDPSSAVGRSRQQANDLGDTPASVALWFSHVENTLLWEWLAPEMPPADGVAAPPSDVAGAPPASSSRLATRLARSATIEEDETLSQLREMLLAKLGADYERLLEEEGEGVSALRAAWASSGASLSASVPGNRRLALTYRLQCERVLKNAMTALDPTIRFEAARD